MAQTYGNLEDSNVPSTIHGVGDVVRAARLRAGYSTEQLAITSGLTEFEIAKIEAGRDNRARLIKRIAGVLKIDLSSLSGALAA
jgi:transcriptional regulator with XRE-family HTH domain